MAAVLLLLTGCTTRDDAGSRGSAEVSTAAAAAHASSRAAPANAVAERFSLYDLGSTWRDQRGDTISLDELAGKVQVVSLVYTSCHATCPAILVELKRIESLIPAARRDDVGFTLVSLDPARDTPGRLAAWADGNQLAQPRWTLLNGSDASVREIAATLGVRYQQLPDGEVAHANVITVLDRTGAVVHQQTTLGDDTRTTADAVLHLLQ